MGAGAFGLMASGVRRALYRYAGDRGAGGIRAAELVRSLNDRLAESTFVVGVVAGHMLMLFWSRSCAPPMIKFATRGGRCFRGSRWKARWCSRWRCRG